MTLSQSVQVWSRPSACWPRCRVIWNSILLGLLVATLSLPIGAQITVNIGPSAALAPAPHKRLDQQFRRRLPSASQAVLERAEQAFLDHMRQTSGLAAEQLATGRIEDDDLSARIDVFMGDHPELAGSVAASAEAPRAQVVDALGRAPDLAKTDTERQALADRFIVWLGGLSGTARDTLLAGRIAPEELQSRIDVFAADIRAERSQVVSDPAVAAVPAISDAFEKANLGPVPERADSICYRGTVSEGAVSRDFVIFKKRPGSIRIHVVQDGLVVGVLGYDGAAAWRQVPGRPPTRIQGPEADALISTARFDDPLVGYRERGARGRLESMPGASPIRLSIREASGQEVIETIDPLTYNELSIGDRNPGGKWEETRFREYRKVGPLSVAGVQEVWIDGTLHSTTRVSEVRLDTGVLTRIFAMPTNPKLDFMDYMGGLEVLAKVAKRDAAGVKLPSEPTK
jgi:hypothetical protein